MLIYVSNFSAFLLSKFRVSCVIYFSYFRFMNFIRNFQSVYLRCYSEIHYENSILILLKSNIKAIWICEYSLSFVRSLLAVDLENANNSTFSTTVPKMNLNSTKVETVQLWSWFLKYFVFVLDDEKLRIHLILFFVSSWNSFIKPHIYIDTYSYILFPYSRKLLHSRFSTFTFLSSWFFV